MDPLQAASVPDSKAISLVYEPLLEVEYGVRPYRLKPCLCHMPEISDDGLTYTYRIREESRFQDDPCFPGGKGRPVTAEDVKYSLERSAKESAMERLTMLDHCEVKGEFEIDCYLKTPDATFLETRAAILQSRLAVPVLLPSCRTPRKMV